jgi:hypothetical protein
MEITVLLRIQRRRSQKTFLDASLVRDLPQIDE